MKLRIQVWRQRDAAGRGRWDIHVVDGIDPAMSVLDVLDRLNRSLVSAGEEAIAFDSDCREGICGACGVTVDGWAQGPQPNTPACHQRLWGFRDGQTVRIGPLRAGAFPVISDLMVNREALDALVEAGGFVDVDAGTAPDAEALPVGHDTAEESLDFGACIGCGACVAACPNGSANLFLGAKLRQLALLPLPSLQRTQRARAMVAEADRLFGPCSLYGECARACPASIPLAAVAEVAKERTRAAWKEWLRP